jgi:hypothetical protein
MTHKLNGTESVNSFGAAIVKALDLLYDALMSGTPGSPSAPEGSASGRTNDERPLESQIDSLILWLTMVAACTGFVTGVPGLVALPLTIPADVTTTVAIQLKLVISIASMCGYDPRDDQVRAFCYVCLCGNAAGDILKGVGIKVGTRFAKQGVQRVSGEMLARINAAVGFRLVTKFGQTGVVSLGRTIPLVSGAIGATFDGTTTAIVGKAAKNTFFGTSEEKKRNDRRAAGGAPMPQVP